MPVLRSVGGNSGSGINAIEAQSPAVIDFKNALVFTGFTSYEPSWMPPENYSVINDPFVPLLSFGLGTGYRIVDGPTTEQPTWRVDSYSTLATNLTVFSTSP